jgi:hypothetical protein
MCNSLGDTTRGSAINSHGIIILIKVKMRVSRATEKRALDVVAIYIREGENLIHDGEATLLR